MNTAPTSERSRPVLASAAAWTASIDTIILNRLSLNAPRNWVQRKGWSPPCLSVSRYVLVMPTSFVVSADPAVR
jgi:hypothetical protein